MARVDVRFRSIGVGRVTASRIRPFPDPPDPMYSDHFDGLRAGRLLARECADCGTWQWPPRPRCAQCYGTEFDPVQIPDRGIVHTFSVMYRAFDPYFVDRVPYAAVAVDLGQGIRMVGDWAGDDVEEVSCGRLVEAVYPEEDSVPVLAWRPVEDAEAK